MSTQLLRTPPDRDAVDRLSAAFHRCFETFEVAADLFAPDALFDLVPPFWRFQLRGPEALAAQLRTIADGPVHMCVLRVVPTASGFVTEHEVTAPGAVARRLVLCEVRDGRITEAVVYCNGDWDDELRARHAVEAPMLRP